MIRATLIAVLAASVAFAAEETADKRLRNATNALRDIMGSPDKGIPEDLLEKAQCVVVVPDLLKAAFIVGAQYGRGFATCRVSDDHWSAPGAARIEGGSFGLQLGGSATDLVMLVMNKRGMEKLLGDKVTIGADIQGAAGPVGRRVSAQTDVLMRAEILTWSRSRGLFGGISLEGATLRPDNGENEKLYGKKIPQRDILEGRVETPPAGRPFVALVTRIGREGGYVTTENRKTTPKNRAASSEARADALNAPGGRMTLAENQVHFATGQATIPADAEPALNEVAKQMKDNPTWTIRIEGYTDNVGNHDKNMALSQQRAEAVMNWLADHGIDRSRMTAKGYGESRPVADNSTDEGRAKNRRVEIVRTDNRSTTGG